MTDTTERKPWWKRWWGIAVIVLVVMSILGSFAPDEEPDQPEAASTPDGSETESEAPSETPTPQASSEPETTAPEAEEAVDPETALRAAILDQIGESNRDIEPRISDFLYSEDPELLILITVAWNDNLTEGLIKDGARLDTTDILEVIATTPGLKYVGVTIEGTFSLVDQLGNASEDRVSLVTYPRETVEAINFDGFNFKNAWEIGESRFVHPAFEY